MKAPVFRIFQENNLFVICDGHVHKAIEPVTVRGQEAAQFSYRPGCFRNDFRIALREYSSCKNARVIPSEKVNERLLEAFDCALLPEKHLLVLEQYEATSHRQHRHWYEVLEAGTVVYRSWLREKFCLAPGQSMETWETVNGNRPFDRQVRITNKDGVAVVEDLDVEKRKAFRKEQRQELIKMGVREESIEKLFVAATVTHATEVAKWIIEEVDRRQRKGILNPVPALLYAVNRASSACYPEDELRNHDIWLPFMRVDIKRALAGAKVILSSGGIRKKEEPKCA